MKICAIICEFNSFHNGHSYLLEQARRLSGCDTLVCVMSGAFTQRGEAAILDKFTRAKHAVLGGSDAVLCLPTAFSVAPAEIFASGAAKIISALPQVEAIAFGCESANIDVLTRSADILNNESDRFKTLLLESLDSGESYIKSLNCAFVGCGGESGILDKPNNLLAIEYIKAFKKLNFKGSFLAIERKGANHGESEARGNICSSSAIRQNFNADFKAFVPDFVYVDLHKAQNLTPKLNVLKQLCLIRDDSRSISQVFGCSEGLENALKNLSNLEYDDIIKQITGKRYTASRIDRLLCANLLKLYSRDCYEYLKGSLYLRPLAIKKERARELLSLLSKSAYPTVIRGRDLQNLSPEGLKCIQSDVFADKIYGFLSGEQTDFFTLYKI